MVLRAGMLPSLGKHRQPANEKGTPFRNEKRGAAARNSTKTTVIRSNNVAC
jgi:hypothetical protein